MECVMRTTAHDSEVKTFSVTTEIIYLECFLGMLKLRKFYDTIASPKVSTFFISFLRPSCFCYVPSYMRTAYITDAESL